MIDLSCSSSMKIHVFSDMPARSPTKITPTKTKENMRFIYTANNRDILHMGNHTYTSHNPRAFVGWRKLPSAKHSRSLRRCSSVDAVASRLARFTGCIFGNVANCLNLSNRRIFSILATQNPPPLWFLKMSFVLFPLTLHHFLARNRHWLSHGFASFAFEQNGHAHACFKNQRVGVFQWKKKMRMGTRIDPTDPTNLPWNHNRIFCSDTFCSTMVKLGDGSSGCSFCLSPNGSQVQKIACVFQGVPSFSIRKT